MKSVKAIVDWLEKTSTPGSENTEQKTSKARENADDFSSSSSKTVGTEMTQALTPVTPITSLRLPSTTPTHPEDDSLAFLGYKSYFNNRPLARCLDTEQEKITTPAARLTSKAASASSCYSVQKLDNIMATLKDMRSVAVAEPSTPTPRSRAQLIIKTSSTTSNDCSGTGIETAPVNNKAEVMVQTGAAVAWRGPAEIKAF